jgi:hypothetical protein
VVNLIRLLQLVEFCSIFCAFSGVVSLASPETAHAAKQTLSVAKIYDLNDRSKHLYNFKNEFEVTADTKRMISTYTDLDGKLLVQETTILKVMAGKEALVSYDLDHKQMGATGRIEVRDGQAHFTYTKGGETKTASEKVGDDFIVSTMIVGFLNRNWEKIKQGEALKVRLGVVDRRETVGFSYVKMAESGDFVKVKMRPSSMIISALVNPLIWTMSPDGSHLKELEGRAQVKTAEGNKFKDFDGYTVYSQVAPSNETGRVK